MNRRKLEIELMKAVLKSSTLEYDEALQVVSSIAQQAAMLVLRKEQQVETKKQEKLKEKQKYESQENSQRSKLDANGNMIFRNDVLPLGVTLI